MAEIDATAGLRAVIHRLPVNLGAEANFTNCIKLAVGKYTAIFHADDLYERTMVAKQVAFLEENPDVVAVFTPARTIDDNDALTGTIGAVPGKGHEVVRLQFLELLQLMLAHHNFLVCPSAMVRTEIYKEIGEWGGRGFRSASDVDMWLRLTRKGTIAVLAEPLMSYRISKAQFSHKNRTRTELLDVFSVFDHYVNDPAVREMLSLADFRHYRWLRRHESVARAMNLFGMGRIEEAENMVRGLLEWDALRAAVSSKRGLVTLAGLVLLRVSLPFGGSPRSRAIVKAAKEMRWR